MALPTSGALSLNDIKGEFGGPTSPSLGDYYAGGSYVPAGTTGTNGAVPSSGTISISNFYGTSSVAINFTNDTVDAGNTGAAANAAYRIDSDGNVYFGVNGTFTSQYAWVSPTSQASNYEVYATFIDGGSFTSGTFDAWVALSSDQTWNMRQATIGSSFGEIFFDVRRIGTTTSLDTWTVQFFAERAT
jgi:hypothetical protein